MKIIWYPAVSLDGYVADARGRSDFVSAEDEREFGKLVNATGAVIVGRRTFDSYHRPQNPFPKARTYVLTQNTELESDDPAVVYVSGGPLEMMRRLHADGRTIAVLSGGGATSGAFAGKGLIDEAWVSVYPLILGAGTRLLGEYQGTMRFVLKEGFMLPGGIVHNRYDVG